MAGPGALGSGGGPFPALAAPGGCGEASQALAADFSGTARTAYLMSSRKAAATCSGLRPIGRHFDQADQCLCQADQSKKPRVMRMTFRCGCQVLEAESGH